MTNVARLIAVALPAALAAGLITCDSPENPYWDPANVSLSSGVLVPQDSVTRVGDTVRVSVAVHLPYLVTSLIIAIGDSAIDTVELPTSSSAVDFTDTLTLVFAVPDTYYIAVTAVRDDGVTVTQALRLIVARRFPGGPCIPIVAGTSLNQAILEASPAAMRPRTICPEPGLYEQNTVRAGENPCRVADAVGHWPRSPREGDNMLTRRDFHPC